jgi:fatty acid/phospholipid biosynthesis enzyme
MRSCDLGHIDSWALVAERQGFDVRHQAEGLCMFSQRNRVKCGTAAVLMVAGAQAAWAQESKMVLFKVVTVKDEIIIGLSADELKALGGADASAVAHALAQKGDMTVWQYNVHRGQNGELQQAPTAKIGVEPYTTPYTILPHQ